jgi:hypothetical protein
MLDGNPAEATRGTDGSNPAPSTSESSANQIFYKSVAQFTRRRSCPTSCISRDFAAKGRLEPLAQSHPGLPFCRRLHG